VRTVKTIGLVGRRVWDVMIVGNLTVIPGIRRPKE
jgi:hypothetical protein